MSFLPGAGIVGRDAPDPLQPEGGLIESPRAQHVAEKADESVVSEWRRILRQPAVAVQVPDYLIGCSVSLHVMNRSSLEAT